MDSISAAEWHKLLGDKRKSAKQFKKELDASVKCPYCLDAWFLYIRFEWFYFQEIPEDAEATFLDANLGPDRIAVPCDCHPGKTGPEGEHRPVKTFADLFGSPIKYHPWGASLKAYRHKLSGINAGYTSEGNYHELAEF